MLSADTPFSFILFGGSGHLATLKIYPALYTLAVKKRLPAQYNIIAFARSAMAEADFKMLVEDSVREHVEKPDETVLTEFLKHVFYVQGQYDELPDFEKLETHLLKLETGWKEPVRVAYLSVPPTIFGTIAKNLCAAGIHESGGPFRCIVEKPVGNDLASFEVLRQQLMESFKENEIYLLDHYLGKAGVRYIYNWRTTNPVLEELLKGKRIHHVEIKAAEAAGLEGRAGYFEHVGMFRDMFQSHLMMIVSLLTMKISDSDEAFQKNRLSALEQIYLPKVTDLNEIVLQGQYATGKIDGKKVIGYQQEQGVADDSRTNTYVALKLQTRAADWNNIPFYLRSGKRLQKKETLISIVFAEEHAGQNRVDINLQGEIGVAENLGMVDLPEHAMLLLEAIHGQTQWYMTFPEVREAWRLLDPIQAHLDKKDTPLHMYPAGTDGPAEAAQWMKKEGADWIS